ncbi:MAG: disulfide bond formation protein B [Hyphomicrobiaceae bacterium]
MASQAIPITRTSAYRMGALALLLSVGVIVTALGFENIGGYLPCPLCTMQRYAYYAAIPLLFLALVLVATERPGLACLVFALVGLAYLANAGLGVYHAGAEWKFWPGPASCAAASGELATNAGSLLKDLERVQVIRCDEAAWRLAGLSFAGWNVLISLLLFSVSLRAAVAARRP